MSFIIMRAVRSQIREMSLGLSSPYRGPRMGAWCCYQARPEREVREKTQPRDLILDGLVLKIEA